MDDIAWMQIAVPPLDDQRALVARIDEISARANAVITRKSREIELLQEFRARLVADVVTGRVDVREIANDLSDIALDARIVDVADVDNLTMDEVLKASEV